MPKAISEMPKPISKMGKRISEISHPKDLIQKTRLRFNDTVLGQYKFNLDFGSPPGELRYCLWTSSDYVSRYRVCGIFQGGLELKESNL